MAVDLEKYRKQPQGASTTPSSTRVNLDKYRKQPTQFKYDVPEAPIQRSNKIAQYQQEAQVAQKEAEQANSLWGKTKNFGKAFGSTIANSEVGLGQSLAKIIGAGDTTLTDAQKSSSDTEIALMKKINELKAKGLDTTRLQQVYNQFKGGQGEVNNLVKEQFNLPTTGQVAGQIGGTALDLLTVGTYGKAKTAGMSFGQLAPKASPFIQKTAVATGLPELAPIAGQKASGLLTKKGLGNIGVGTGIGYASDVTQGLQGARGEDRTGAKAFIPGIGTLIGGGLPAISEGAQSVRNVRSGTYDIQRRSNQLENIGKRYNKVGEAFDMGSKNGVDVKKILSETNILNGAVDEDGLITAKTALENFDSAIAPYEGKVRDVIQKENAKVQISDIASKMDDFVSKSKLQGESQTKLQNSLFADLKGLQSRYGDTIPVEALHDIKVFRGNASNYADTGANVINKDATRFFKEMVENNTRSFDVKGYNKQLSKLYTVKDAIEALDKKRVRGGRMGKFFASTVGAIVGGSTGNPFLSILGAEGGRMGQGSILERSLGGDIAKGLEIPTELTDILTKKVSPKEVIPPVVIPKKNPIGTLDLQSKKEGSLKITQATTIAPTKNVIPKIIPTKPKTSSKGLGTVTPNKGGDLLAEAQKYNSVEDFVKAKTETKDFNYSHRPSEGPRAFDLTEKVDGEQMIPSDMYSQWYGSRGTPEDIESINALKKVKGNPEAEVTIYRASPSTDFNYGDWVTLSKKYAKQHAESNGDKTFKVSELRVKAKDIRWAMDDVNEFGYFPDNYKSQLTDIWNKSNKK